MPDVPHSHAYSVHMNTSKIVLISVLATLTVVAIAGIAYRAGSISNRDEGGSYQTQPPLNSSQTVAPPETVVSSPPSTGSTTTTTTTTTTTRWPGRLYGDDGRAAYISAVAAKGQLSMAALDCVWDLHIAIGLDPYVNVDLPDDLEWDPMPAGFWTNERNDKYNAGMGLCAML